ncbi:hypothetical protein CBR_g84897 [Chara braunii]|uniref:C3H1-type domain-containing protein n=1 Tax=Chara braunii TaxID=69332 RepID=A0A388KAZ3_CHABU|nr:hypothetical protein CBR_g84897 [Chara braunii]|eukprot:GBG67234.1 hypothetical protein CBR_g84897 [Chara braunii]
MGDHGLEVGSRKPLSPGASIEKAGSRENSRISLLELAANNDLDGFRHAVEVEGAQVDELGSWYGRQNGTNQMVLEQRTPSMIAALYGSVDVLSYILSFFDACGCDINRKCGVDGSTALHCAAAGGTPRAVETVALLLRCGADRDSLDNHGRRAVDVVFTPKMPHIKAHLDRLLRPDSSSPSSSSSSSSSSSAAISVPSSSSLSRQSLSPAGLNSSTSSSFHDNSTAAVAVASLPFSSVSSPPTPNGCDVTRGKPSFLQLSSNGSASSSDSAHLMGGGSLSNGGSSDGSLPDVKSSIYATDEFRMYSFKVKSCSRAYSHDWTECPFVHPGENARRRDPRRYHYSCVPCPDFRKGSCRRGDSCEYAHGVFECWLHPAQYRTRLCKEGLKCTRRVCFFAHTSEELRPLYTTSGSATLPSPRCTSPIDMRSLSPPLPPPSPQSVLFPYSPATSPSGLPTPPLSPSTSSSLSVWSPNVQSSVPTLHLPTGLHAARVRGLQAAQAQAQAAAAAKVRADGHRSSAGLEPDADRLVDLAALSISRASPVPSVSSPSSSSALTARIGHALHANFPNVAGGLQMSNASLDSLISSAAAAESAGALGGSSAAAALQSVLQSRQQQQQQQHAHQHQWRLNGSVSPLSSPIRRSVSARYSSSERDQSLIALSPSLAAAVLNRKHSFSGHEKYLDSQWRVSANGGPATTTAESSFLNLGGCSASSMMTSSTTSSGVDLSDWGSPTGKLDWGVSNEQFARFRKSTSYLPSLSSRASSLLFDEPIPDLTWVQKLVRETAGEATADCAASAALECLPRESSMERIMAGRWVDPLLQERVA